MEPFDYLMFRGEQDPRGRSAMLSVVLLDVAPDFARLRAAMDRASRVVLRLRQHVVVPALPLGSPQWILDPDFDLDFHVRRVRLTEPGTLRQLLDFAQPILNSPFDTARPLWEAHLVEGVDIDGASAALLYKLHHAVTDGVGGVELFKQLYDFEREPDRGPMPSIPSPEDVSSTDIVRSAARRAPVSVVAMAANRSSQGVRVTRRIVADPLAALRDVSKFVSSAQRVLGPPPVPPSPLLRRRGLGRRLETYEFPLDDFRRAAKAGGGSVNDAFISGIGGVLRLYHEALGVMVDAVPLALPVSLRSDDDPAGGNRFAGARIAAPVSEPDPARRIARIREQILNAVGEPAINALGSVAPALSRLPAPLLGAISGIASTTDVQASNVPGYPEAPYLAGSLVLKTFPFGPVPGVPMMIILVTQAGVCYLGVHYDTAAITDHELFARCLREGFDEILAMGKSSPDPRPKKHAAVRPSRATKRSPKSRA